MPQLIIGLLVLFAAATLILALAVPIVGLGGLLAGFFGLGPKGKE